MTQAYRAQICTRHEPDSVGSLQRSTHTLAGFRGKVGEERGRERDRGERKGDGNGVRVKDRKVKATGIHPTAEGRTRSCGCT